MAGKIWIYWCPCDGVCNMHSYSMKVQECIKAEIVHGSACCFYHEIYNLKHLPYSTNIRLSQLIIAVKSVQVYAI